MRTLLSISAAALTLLIVPGLCLALMEIEIVSKERAKQLGMEVRCKAAGPDAVRVVLEFKAEGELKSYKRVELEVHDRGTLQYSSILREEKAEPGRVVVSFAADRGNLDRITLRVVTESGEERTGYDLRVREFVDLGRVR